MDLTGFAEEVGTDGEVGVVGLATRQGTVAERLVTAPRGILRIDPEEMVVECAAATPVDELVAALGAVGQTVGLPPGGTVGGALARGRSDHRLLGYGPIRDTLLQMHYVSADGIVVMAGGPTVKNVSGFDLCRLFVGACGTLGFFGTVLLRTRPLPQASQWFEVTTDAPASLLGALYKPISVLWNGREARVLLEGAPSDVAAQAQANALRPVECGWPLAGQRNIHQPGTIPAVDGAFVAQIGTGVLWSEDDLGVTVTSPRLEALRQSVKDRFDPRRRLNPAELSSAR